MYDVTNAAAVQLPAEHQSGADAVRHLDVDEVVDAAAGTEVRLAQRAEVTVVADEDPAAQCGETDVRGRVDAVEPAGRRVSVQVHRRRKPEDRADDAPPRQALRGRHRGDEVGGHGERVDRRRVLRQLAEALVDERPGGVPDTDPDVPVADVHRDRQPGRRRQRQQRRRPPAPAAPPVGAPGLPDHPVALQVGDDARDGVPRQPGGPAQVGPAHHVCRAQHRENPLAVEVPHGVDGAARSDHGSQCASCQHRHGRISSGPQQSALVLGRSRCAASSPMRSRPPAAQEFALGRPGA
nr:hypothetical protein [Virgisporangium aurantiacum]